MTTAGLSWFTVDAVGAAAPPDTGPLLLDLGDFGSDRTELVGAKAANLARASYAGLPVLPGFVVTTHAAARVRRGEQLPEQALRTRWKQLSGNGTRALIVRSSSVAEDSATSSMAGRFDSVLDVRGWDGFLDAVRQVVGSADAVGSDAPIAVLVQPMSTAQLGGVLFGLDPLTGDRRRLFASVVAGLPEEIVSGAATGTSVVLSRGLGRALETVGPQVPGLTAGLRYRLAALARRTRSVFGSPQDMEWLVDADGVLRLLQSRPVTAAAVPPRHSRPLGTAPIAETFPDALSTLERDLWQRPLDEGIRAALELSGAASRAVLSRPLVHSFGGRLAVDLAAIGAAPGPRRSWLDLIDPRTGLRKLRAAWRIGRLRTAYPMLVEDLVDQVDEQ
ncbi:MAG: hypothetical protein HOQ24_17710 [Mycobacteriaceae bacterium]|nr:hypothetical protein [Mycobacteriaceae bacterium]